MLAVLPSSVGLLAYTLLRAHRQCHTMHTTCCRECGECRAGCLHTQLLSSAGLDRPGGDCGGVCRLLRPSLPASGSHGTSLQSPLTQLPERGSCPQVLASSSAPLPLHLPLCQPTPLRPCRLRSPPMPRCCSQAPLCRSGHGRTQCHLCHFHALRQGSKRLTQQEPLWLPSHTQASVLLQRRRAAPLRRRRRVGASHPQALWLCSKTLPRC